MNNEPVAWYKKNSNDYLIENIGQPSFQVQEFIDAGYIPLYTHPVKELTMAEIEDFINAYGLDMGDVYEFSFAQLTKMIVEIEHQIRGGK